jgi:predicted dehydrogenase
VNWIITNWFRSQTYYNSGGWRATWKGEGGGVLLNQCPHQLDLFQWLFGLPVKVRAFASLGKYHEIEVEDDVTAYCEFENGATGVFISSTGEAPGTNRLEVTGDRGRIVVEDGKIKFDRTEVSVSGYIKNSPNGFGVPEIWNVEVPAEEPPGKQHQRIIENFVNAILDDSDLIAKGEEGIRSVEFGNAMLYSALKDVTVDMPLDGDAYEKMLQSLIENSTFKKKEVKEKADEDFSKSFNAN